MGRKRLPEDERKVNINLRIKKQVVDEYKAFVKEKGGHISPRIERFMIEEMQNQEGN